MSALWKCDYTCGNICGETIKKFSVGATTTFCVHSCNACEFMCMQNVIQDKRGFRGLGAVCACWEGVMQGLIRRDFCSAVNNSLKIWVNDTFDFQAALLTWAREWGYEWIRGFEKDVRVWQRPNWVCWSNIGIFFLYVHYELIPTALYVERVYMEIGHTYSECIYTCNFCNPQGSGGQECRHG